MSIPEPALLRSSRVFSQLKTASAALVAIIATFVLLALTYNVVNPPFEAPDEYQHFFTARHLAQGHGFASPDAEQPWFQEAAQPPLYYLLAAALMAPIDTSDAESMLWMNEHAATGYPGSFGNKNQIVHTEREGWPYRQTVLAVHVARAFSIVLGAATVLLIYAIARVLAPAAPRIALVAAALTAFTPQFVFLSASVSNDNVANATAALAAWVLLRGLRVSRPRGWAVALGVALGLAGLSKVSGMLFWPVAGATILLVGWRRRELRRTLLDLAVIFALAGAIAGWWYLRNWLLYRDPTGVSAIVSLIDQTPTSGAWDELMGEVRGLRFSYWGMFGWFNVLSPIWLYQLAHYLTVLALLALPLALVPRLYGRRASHVRPEDLKWFLVPAMWIALVVIALLRYDRLLPALQGRLLMPASWGINLFLVLGWAGLVLAIVSLVSRAGRRLRWLAPRFVAALPLGLLAAWTLAAPFAIIAPAYARPLRVTPAAVPAAARRGPVEHGAYVRFLGGTVERDTVRPGENLHTTAYWETLARFPADYTAFVHVLAPDGRALADVNSWPGRGGYPTRLWRPGEVVVDVQQITIPWEAEQDAPSLLTLDAGFFLYPTNELLAGHTANGRPARSLLGQVRLLPGKRPAVQPSTELIAQFGDSIQLLSYTLTPGSEIRAGQPLTLTLYWDSTARPQEDWTVFVHLCPNSAMQQIGWDGPPRSGAWPTSAWEPGYVVEDVHVLEVGGEAPDGLAELWIGLYRADGTRLPVSTTRARTQDQAIYLQDVLVQP